MNSKHYACIGLAVYVAILAVVLPLVGVTPQPAVSQPQSHIIHIEYVKPEPPPKPKEKPKPKPKPKVKEAPKHEKLSTKDNTQQTQGKAEKSRTVNKRALFQQSKAGVDKPANIGNERAEQDTVLTASGKGNPRILNPEGTIEIDEGLQGRNIKGKLPEPDKTRVTKPGKVQIRVKVNKSGVVTEASFVPKGSTTQEAAAVEAARAAALNTVFTEGKAYFEGGVITYTFKQGL